MMVIVSTFLENRYNRESEKLIKLGINGDKDSILLTSAVDETRQERNAIQTNHYSTK